MTNKKPNPKVFISYSHDCEEHSDKVLGLGASLTEDGCACCIDVYKPLGPTWADWMTEQLTSADFVICVISQQYQKRFDNREEKDIGHGVVWESKLIKDYLYQSKTVNTRILPVFFCPADRQYIPNNLKGYTYFCLDNEGYEPLYRVLTEQPLQKEPELGDTIELPPKAVKRSYQKPGQAESSAQADDNNCSKKHICWERLKQDVINILQSADSELFEHLNHGFYKNNAAELAEALYQETIKKILGRFELFLDQHVPTGRFSSHSKAVDSIIDLTHIWLALSTAEFETNQSIQEPSSNTIRLHSSTPVKPDIEGQLAVNENRRAILILVGDALCSPLDFTPKLQTGIDKNDKQAYFDIKNAAQAKVCSGMRAFVSDTRHEFEKFLCQPGTELKDEDLQGLSSDDLNELLDMHFQSLVEQHPGKIYIRIPACDFEAEASQLLELQKIWPELLILEVKKEKNIKKMAAISLINKILYKAHKWVNQQL